MVRRFACPSICCNSVTGNPLFTHSVANWCRMRCGCRLPLTSMMELKGFRISLIALCVNGLCGFLRPKNRCSSSVLGLTFRYCLTAITARTLKYEVLCLFPLPSKCTSRCFRSAGSMSDSSYTLTYSNGVWTLTNTTTTTLYCTAIISK